MLIRPKPRPPAGVFSFLLILLAIACGKGGESAPVPARSGAATGRRAEDAAPVRRIVSLAPNLTEILFALGLGDRVVGVTDFCNYPPEALRIAKVGGYVNPSAEAILALRPDLVVATPNAGNRPFVERFMAVGARVEVVQARNVAEIFPAIAGIAEAAGVPEEGARLAKEIRRAIERQKSRVASLPRPRVLFCLQVEPLVVAGHGSYPGDLIEVAGGENIAPRSDSAYPTLSLESVIASRPDVIIQSLMDSGSGPAGEAALQAFWRRFASIPAVASGSVSTVPGDLVLRPGPRIAEGISALIELIHGGRAQGVDAPGSVLGNDQSGALDDAPGEARSDARRALGAPIHGRRPPERGPAAGSCTRTWAGRPRPAAGEAAGEVRG